MWFSDVNGKSQTSSLTFTFVPPGGAVHQVWDAGPAEFHHQAEGGGGQRGPETSEKVRAHLHTLGISAATTRHRRLSSLLVPAGTLICGVWSKNSWVVFQRGRHAGDLIFKTTTTKENKQKTCSARLPASQRHARCDFVHVWCIYSCPESGCYLCFSLHHHTQQRGTKAFQIPPLWSRMSLKISCFVPKYIQSTKHPRVSQQSARWKAESTNTSEVGGISWEMLHWLENGAFWCHWNSPFLCGGCLDGPTTFQMNVYSYFITKFRGTTWICFLLYVCVTTAHRFEKVGEQAQRPLNLIDFQWFKTVNKI